MTSCCNDLKQNCEPEIQLDETIAKANVLSNETTDSTPADFQQAGDTEVVSETEQLRAQIDESRAALAQKLEMLEIRVSETVQAATTSMTEVTTVVAETVTQAKETVENTVNTVHSAVQGTVDTMRDSITGTVNQVKQTFDIQSHVERYPWQTLTAAVATGYLVDRVLQSGSRSRQHQALAKSTGQRVYPVSEPMISAPERRTNVTPHQNLDHYQFSVDEQPTPNRFVPQQPSTASWSQYLAEQFGPEISQVKTFAVSATVGLVRDLVKDSVSQTWRPQITELFDRLTTKLVDSRNDAPGFAGSRHA